MAAFGSRSLSADANMQVAMNHGHQPHPLRQPAHLRYAVHDHSPRRADHASAVPALWMIAGVMLGIALFRGDK